jgi:hypothetical protein
MGYENMIAAGRPPEMPQQPNWDQPQVDGRLALPETQQPLDGYQGLDHRSPGDVEADNAAAVRYEATFSDPRTRGPGRLPVEAAVPPGMFPELYGGSSEIIRSMEASGASRNDIATELGRLLSYQQDLMGIIAPVVPHSY